MGNAFGISGWSRYKHLSRKLIFRAERDVRISSFSFPSLHVDWKVYCVTVFDNAEPFKCKSIILSPIHDANLQII